MFSDCSRAQGYACLEAMYGMLSKPMQSLTRPTHPLGEIQLFQQQSRNIKGGLWLGIFDSKARRQLSKSFPCKISNILGVKRLWLRTPVHDRDSR